MQLLSQPTGSVKSDLGNGRSLSSPDCSVVVPVFNEEDSIAAFVDQVAPVLTKIGLEWEILFVNDGSVDSTIESITDAIGKDARIRAIDLSRNFGKEIALCAGLDEARGRSVIPMDVDLQDPPELIPQMIELWNQGYEVVQAKRVDRRSDGFLKKISAALFYRVINRLSPISIPPNVGDFRLLDARVVTALGQYRERERFMKGIFASVGFRTATVEYVRPARAHGSTKFSAVSLAQLSIQGITSFSALPLKIWTYIGLLIALGGIFYAAFIVTRTLIFGIVVPGYASLVVFTLFFNGLTLIGLGIQGEYIARIFTEVKQRPLYLVRERMGAEIVVKSAIAAASNPSVPTE